jgi:hypothetical protein
MTSDSPGVRFEPPARSPGPTHRKSHEHLETVGVVPAGDQAAGLDAVALPGVLAQDVERDAAEEGGVLGGAALVDAALILAEAHVQHPMHRVPDAPMTAHCLPQRLGRQRSAEQVVPSPDRRCVRQPTLGLDHADRLQSRPPMGVLHPRQHVGIGDHPPPAQLQPPVPLVDRFVVVVLHPSKPAGLRLVETRLHVRRQRGLIVLECRDIVAALVEPLLGDGPLAAHRIERHQATREFQGTEQLGNERDLVGLVFHLRLGEHKLLLRCPGTDQLNRRLAPVPVV